MSGSSAVVRQMMKMEKGILAPKAGSVKKIVAEFLDKIAAEGNGENFVNPSRTLEDRKSDPSGILLICKNLESADNWAEALENKELETHIYEGNTIKHQENKHAYITTFKVLENCISKRIALHPAFTGRFQVVVIEELGMFATHTKLLNKIMNISATKRWVVLNKWDDTDNYWLQTVLDIEDENNNSVMLDDIAIV